MAEFRMPSLGADMDFGTVIAWHVGVGDHVTRGQVVAEVDTDKSVIEVEVFTAGTITELLVGEGERVPVGTPLAIIADDAASGGPAPANEVAAPEEAAPGEAAPGEAALDERPLPGGQAPTEQVAPAQRATIEQAAPPGSERTQAPGRAGAAPEAVPARRGPVSPLARRQAAELGLDLATVTGTGPGGAITADDVARAVSARPSFPAVEGPTRPAGPDEAGPDAPGRAGPGTAPPPLAESPALEVLATVGPAAVGAGLPSTTPLSGADRQSALRRAIAAAMARSKREIPHYYLTAEIDVGRAMGWLDARNAGVPVTARVLPVTVLLKAVALALRKTPDLNGFWTGEAFEPGRGIHLGVAIALRGGGLIAPAIHDADRLTIEELMAALRDLVGRARMGRIRGSEMSEPTITVTSLGDQGVDLVAPVIYPPQVAIVGFGRIRERAAVENGVVVPRTSVLATLAADHRASDGHRGALFLTELDSLLHTPGSLSGEAERPTLHQAED